MKIAIYGLTITSSWGNGHATTYRSLCRALARRGHRIEFIEKDVDWYRNNRDLPSPEFCTVHLYENWLAEEDALLCHSNDADAIIVGSYFPDAVQATEALLERGCGPLFFYDIDTPVTVAQLRQHGRAPYLKAALVPHYAAYLSFTGGPILRELEQRFGSPRAVPLYCSVDPERYRRTDVHEAFRSDLSYLGTYAADRQAKLERMLTGTAERLPESRFLVAGPLYPAGLHWPANVRRMEHLSPPEHPGFYSSSRFTLNLTRADMVEAGYSPSVRLFEASACAAAILSDDWPGLEEFFTPGESILLPREPEEAVKILTGISDEERTRIGMQGRARILEEHTSEHRAIEVESIVADCSQ